MPERVPTVSEELPATETLSEGDTREEEMDVDVELQSMEQAVDGDVQELLARIDVAEATAPSVQEGQTSSEFARRISSIKERVSAIRAEMHARIVDFRVRSAMRSSSVEGKSERIYWYGPDKYRGKLKQVVDSLTSEELRTQATLLKQVQDEVTACYEKQDSKKYDFGGDDLGTMYLSRINTMFESHPDVFDEFTHTPGILQLQKQALVSCLQDAGNQHHAAEYAKKIYIDESYAQQIVSEAIRSALEGNSEGHKGSMWRIGKAIENFKIPLEERTNFAILSVRQQLIRNDSSFSSLSATAEKYNVSPETMIRGVKERKEEFLELAYTSAVSFMKRSGNRNNPPALDYVVELKLVTPDEVDANFIEYLDSHPEAQRDIVLHWVRTAPHELLGERTLAKTAHQLFMTSETVQEILKTKEAQAAGIESILIAIKVQSLLTRIEDIATLCGLDIEALKKDSSVQDAIELALVTELEKTSEHFPTDVAIHLGFDMEKIRAVALKTISGDFKAGRFRLFELLSVYSLTKEEKEAVSQEAFGTPDEFDNIERVYRFSTDFRDTNKNSSWAPGLLTPDIILAYVLDESLQPDFPSVDISTLADVLVHTKSPRLARSFLGNTRELEGLDTAALISDVVSVHGAEFVADSIDTIEGLPPHLIAELVPGYMTKDFGKAVEINRSMTPPPVPSLTRFVKIVGAFGSRDLYDLYMKSGEDDVLFKHKVESVKGALLKSDSTSIEELLQDSTLLNLAEAFARVKDSAFGEHDTDTFRSVFERYQKGRESYAPLPEGYKPGVIETFKKPKNTDQEGYTYSPEFTERWKVLKRSAMEALTLQGKEFDLDQKETQETVRRALYRRFLREILRERIELNETLQQTSNEKARMNLESRIQRISSIDVRTPEGMADAFTKLYNRKKSPELAEIFRVYGFLEAAEQQVLHIGPYVRALAPESPSAEDISKVIDFVQHMAHREVWEKKEAFATKEVQEGLDSLFHVKALENELARMTGGGAKGESTTLDVVPSRGILTELSGHMGDACWASKYEILKEFPNVSSLSFFQGDKAAGSCLLIDTQTGDGTPLTIIRGLNPLEAVINKLDIESFVTSVKEYVGAVAQERGRRLAIVMDDHSGGSGTNRPFLFTYLSGFKHSLQKVKGLSTEDTTFNGYNITGDTYYL